MTRSIPLSLLLGLFACRPGPREGLRLVLDASPDAIPVLKARLEQLDVAARVDADPAGGVRVDLPPLRDAEAVKAVLLKPGVITLRPESGESRELRRVVEAKVTMTEWSGPVVAISLDPTGAKAFERMTGENIQRKIAILMDGKLLMEPVVQEVIKGGRLQITLGRREGGAADQLAEANALAATLSGGALPGPVTVRSAAAFKE